MKILLIRPYFRFYPHEYLRGIPEPLGLEYLAAMVREKHEVKILDCVAENWGKPSLIGDYIHVGLHTEEIKERIKRFSPDIVGVSCLFASQSANTKEIVDVTKEVNKDIVTIVGGAHPTATATEYLENNLSTDIIVVGEGEITFSELVDCLAKGGDIKEVKGICYRDKKNGITMTGKRENVKDLDSLPFPARDLVPYEEYSKMHLPAQGIIRKLINLGIPAKIFYSLLNKKQSGRQLPIGSMITSRGCPNNCYFCAVLSVWGRAYRMRSAKRVVDEIELLCRRFGTKRILFQDDNITVSQKRTVEICKQIIDRKINIEWTCPSGVYAPSLDEEVLGWMKKAGCYRLEFGIESGNQEILDKVIAKRQNLEHVSKVLQICRQLGIETRGFYILGLPGETLKTMIDTVKFAAASGTDSKLMIVQPWPGSRLYEDVVKKGMLAQDYDYTKLRVRSDKAYICTSEFSPQEVLAIRDVGNKILREKNYEKYAAELERLLQIKFSNK